MLLQLDIDFIHNKAAGFLQRRHLILFSDRELELLACAKIWYMDGTFRVVNNPWQQLFSIHAFIKSGNSMKQIPLVFCVMSGKRKEDYYEVCYF